MPRAMPELTRDPPAIAARGGARRQAQGEREGSEPLDVRGGRHGELDLYALSPNDSQTGGYSEFRSRFWET